MLKNPDNRQAVTLFSGDGMFAKGLVAARISVVLCHADGDASAAALKKSNRKVISVAFDELTGVKIMRMLKVQPHELFLICDSMPMPENIVTEDDYRKYLNDPWDGHLRRFITILRKSQPRFFLMDCPLIPESLQKVPFMEATLMAFAKISYDTLYIIEDAANYGAPESYRRIFLVGANNCNDTLRLRRPTYMKYACGDWRQPSDGRKQLARAFGDMLQYVASGDASIVPSTAALLGQHV